MIPIQVQSQPPGFGEKLLGGALPVLGKAVGSYFGPVGGAIGGMIGGAVGGDIAKGQQFNLPDLKSSTKKIEPQGPVASPENPKEITSDIGYGDQANSAVDRRMAHLDNIDVMNQGLSAMQSNPDLLKKFGPVLNDAISRAKMGGGEIT
jgi:hypothetical protein